MLLSFEPIPEITPAEMHMRWLDIGKRIRIKHRLSGLTIAETLAMLPGVNRRKLLRYQNGFEVPIPDLLRLARVYHCTAGYLLEGEFPESPTHGTRGKLLRGVDQDIPLHSDREEALDILNRCRDAAQRKAVIRAMRKALAATNLRRSRTALPPRVSADEMQMQI